MNFREIDEADAKQYFDMLKEAPAIPELLEKYPGLENLVHVLTAQLTTFFMLPYLEREMGAEDLIEAFRRYLYTAFAFGVIMRDSDLATRYVMDLYNTKGGNAESENVM
ncbi:hypothetical protein SAMN05660649_02462 [Desulfotomaculum arcticum]|uniref:Uncharacterized protein n=1 Tax=Desulfotruncus arcticus DSM 17038 TaxID=1121424 RepID=A0A1I2U9E0_9FIRM|nr:hypothetical protein [Desulfotruncus arcticus]SFG71231.1 hypothetical protein SAMN05660649_02462 [Desulfotomaculum arcticum] [Desulfotruncus arcticus DSM 17038]